MLSNLHDLKNNLVRSRIYSDLSILFHEPTPEAWQALESGRLIQNLSEFRQAGSGSQAMADLSLENPASLPVLHEEHRHVFGHTSSQEYPPYETQYGSAHVFMQTQDMADIAGFYKAFGLSAGREIRERVDHLSLELEFMSFLACKQSHACCYGSQEQVRICHDAQKRFLEEHLARWIPAFASKLGQYAPDSFFSHLATLLKSFVAADAALLGANPSPLRAMDTQIPPFEVEGAAACGETESCPLGSDVPQQEEKEL